MHTQWNYLDWYRFGEHDVDSYRFAYSVPGFTHPRCASDAGQRFSHPLIVVVPAQERNK